MNIAIIGSRGIPNNYGGFEQFAEHLSQGLTELGHNVSVYNPHTHPYKKNKWKDVNIIHCNDPEDKIGTIGQFVYDFNCILDSRKRDFDIILQLGYTSSTVWGWLLPRKKSIIITNMDGLEWKRSKYSGIVKLFLKYAEKLAVKYSDHLIADSITIQKYLKHKYQKKPVFIPYGANIFNTPDENILQKYQLQKNSYNILIARFEPENNIETILDASAESGGSKIFLVVGNYETTYGNFIIKKYAQHKHIRFLNSIYNQTELDNLRFYSHLYFHGHSVGGTNPSLIEAMASGALICAHDNLFNRAVLGNDGYYFSSTKDAATLMNKISKKDELQKLNNNLLKIENIYSWESIIRQYEKLFEKVLEKKNYFVYKPQPEFQHNKSYI